VSSPIGLALSSLSGLPPRRLALLAAVAEQRGFEFLALTESHNDVFPLAAGIAACTREVTIATTIANIGFRHPALMALSAATVDDLSDGRFVLGLGVGTQWFDLDQRPKSSLDGVREYVAVVRQVLASGHDSSQRDGDHYRLDRFHVDFQPMRPDIPIYLAALNDGMLRLAGEIADGVVLNLVPLDLVPSVVATVREAAADAGRDPARVRITMMIRAGLEADIRRAREIVRESIPRYLTFPGYARRFRQLGYGAAVDAAERGDSSAIPDELVDRLAVFGPDERCRAGVEAFRSAGIDLPIVSPRTFDDDWEATIERAMDVFGPSLTHTRRW
jgi:alkanesulfonate monooxygenase SsuD/methylene tetrahydromethanopterin reductase-like flavin-dependent oxidoreductase (luciferase family)